MGKGKRFTEESLKLKGFSFDAQGRISKATTQPPEKVKRSKKPPEPSIYEAIKDSYQFFIQGNTPSSKNSRINFTQKDSAGNPVLTEKGKFKQRSMKSEYSSDWEKQVASYMDKHRSLFLSLVGDKRPVRVTMFFLRKTRGKWDFHNAVQIVADAMTRHGWIPDDDAENLLIYPPNMAPYYGYDKENPGVLIRVK